MNVRAATVNLAGLVVKRVEWIGRRSAKRARRAWRSGRSRVGRVVRVAPVVGAGRRAVAGTRALPVRVSRGATRARKRASRFHEHVVEPWLEQQRIERELASLARSDEPIVVGPWLSEVGYEVLYWRPFLSWVVRRYEIAPERLIAVSRGGVSDWYGTVAGRYVELLDLLGEREFAEKNAARQAGGDQKQLAPGAFDAEIVARVADRYLDGRTPRLCHPSLMFRLFRRFWFGDRSLDFFLRHMRFEPLTCGAGALDGLPDRFAAVKFYTGAAIPDTPERRRALRSLVERLSEEMPVVVLDTGLALDDHRDFLFEGIANVTPIRERMAPTTNLGVQTRAIARASLFVGTCGSLAWLAPMLGTPTIGVYADDRFLAPHLFVAWHAYRQIDAAMFSTLDLRCAESFDLVPMTAATAGGRTVE